MIALLKIGLPKITLPRERTSLVGFRFDGCCRELKHSVEPLFDSTDCKQDAMRNLSLKSRSDHALARQFGVIETSVAPKLPNRGDAIAKPSPLAQCTQRQALPERESLFDSWRANCGFIF